MSDRALLGTPLAREAAGLDACVHCGFCLTACPTYLTLEDENDSPRGRLVLMRALLEGDIAPTDPDAGTHLDRCLGCRACETVCPSGVPYGHLLEATRATLAGQRPLPVVARALLYVFARPRMLAFAMACARLLRATGLPALGARLPGQIGFSMAMLASTARARVQSTSPAPLGTTRRGSVVNLTGCVTAGLLSPINRDTETALAAQGYQIAAAPAQRCCGALHAHAGDAPTARDLARHNIVAFEASDAEYVAVNSAGCGAMLKDYGRLLHDDPAWRDRAAAVAARVRDVSELLAIAGGPLPASGNAIRVTYDAPCHLQHAQRITEPPLAVLRSIGGLALLPLAGSDQCCGSAGIYSLVQPGVSQAVLAPKLAAIEDTGAAVVVTGNPGCLMQIGAGLLQSGSRVVARHPVELLAAAYEKRWPGA